MNVTNILNNIQLLIILLIYLILWSFKSSAIRARRAGSHDFSRKDYKNQILWFFIRVLKKLLNQGKKSFLAIFHAFLSKSETLSCLARGILIYK